MRSVTSYFNKTIFLKNLKRFWPLWTIYIIIWSISLPIALPAMFSRYNDYVSVGRYILQLGVTMGAIMGLIFGLLSSVAVFSYLYRAKSVGAFHSLPIRREGLFLSNYLSGIVLLLVSNVIIFALSVVSELVFGVLEMNYLLQWLAIVSLESVFFFSFGSFCAMLTGQSFALAFIYGVLNFAVVVIEAITRYCTSIFSYGVSATSSPTLGVFSPVYRILDKSRIVDNTIGETVISYSYKGWSMLIIYCVVGLVFAAAGLLIYRRRKSENAAEFIAIGALRPVFKYFFAFIGSLVLGILFYTIIFNYSGNGDTGSAIPMLSCMLFGGFLGYFITAMLLKKSFRVFKIAGLGFIIFSLALIAFVAAFEFDLFGIERYVPESSSVEVLHIRVNGEIMNFDEKEIIEKISSVQQGIISDKSEHEAYVREFKVRQDMVYGESVNVYMTYTLNNGKTVSRRYLLYKTYESDQQNLAALEASLNSARAISDRLSDVLELTEDSISWVELHYVENDNNYKSHSITGSSAKEFLTECVQPDIRNGNLGKASLDNSDKIKEGFTIVIHKHQSQDEINPDNPFKETQIRIYPDKESEKTLAYLKTLGIEPQFDVDFDSALISEKYA